MEPSAWLVAVAVVVSALLVWIGLAWLGSARRHQGRLPLGVDLIPGALLGLLGLVLALWLLWSIAAM